MGAEVVPFPVVRRLAFLERQVAVAASLRPTASARYISYQLQVQANTMRRKGMAEHYIADEIAAMETEILRGLDLRLADDGGAA